MSQPNQPSQRLYDPSLGINPPHGQLNRQERYQFGTYMLVYPWGDFCPWTVQNKLDPNFVEFMATKWLNHSKGSNSYRWVLSDLSQAKSAFRSSCAKNPNLMDSYWLEYQDAIAHVVERIQRAIAENKKADKKDLELLEKHQRAVIYRLPDECPDSASQDENITKGLLLTEEQLKELLAYPLSAVQPVVQSNEVQPKPQPMEQSPETKLAAADQPQPTEQPKFKLKINKAKLAEAAAARVNFEF